ncbi:MAG TPA: autotransporter-associated beta strand repeat-containing protein, partial [Chthoniobacteraceae bacterium]|nr:autotransporter-associated beta strand repeat-containing protein [Chthoniobacteraceae bacterium]
AGIIEVSTALTNLTFNGAADFSTGGLTKAGPGTLTLQGSNGYLGATTTSAGTLALDGGGSIVNTADFIVGNTTGTAAAFNLINGSVSLSGANLLTGGAATTPLTTSFTYNQTGGTLEFTNAVGFIGISNNGGTSAVTVSGGTFTAFNDAGMNLGVRGDANLTVSSTGTVTLPALSYGHPSTTGGNSVVNLNGGTLQIGAGRIVRSSGLATFNFNGGILQPTAASTTFMTGLTATNVRNGGAIVDTNGFDITIGQSLTHSTIGGDNATDGGLTKNGAGTLILAGSNSYNGPTNLTAGKLFVAGSLSSAGTVSVANGTTFGGSGSAGTTTVAGGGAIEAGLGGSGQLTLTGLTFSGAGTVNFGTVANYAATSAMQVTSPGALIPNGAANSVSLNIASLSGIALATPYKLISYAGAIGGSGFGAFQLAPLPNRAVGALSDTGSEIRLTISSTDFVKWTGASVPANGWDTTTQNWKLGSNNLATTYINTPADAVVFDDDVNPANTTVAIDAANVSPASVSFANATKDYIVQGNYGITGATGFTKTGAAAVTIATANSYTGATTISTGVLNIQNADALGSTISGTTVASGAALQIQGFITTAAEALTLNGTGVANDGALRNIADFNTYAGLVTLGSSTRINSDSGTLMLSNPGTITGTGFGLLVGGAGDTTIASIIGTGSGNLIKDGAGTLTLNGVNTFAGGVVISEGILRAGSDLALGAVSNSVT